MEKKKILIIEDDKAIVDVITMILEHDGFKVDHAYNGIVGIEKFKEDIPDIVLLDIKMPRMDGIEVLQELRQISTEPVIIMISGHGNIETAVQTTRMGAYDFISKPFDVDRLKLTIENGLKYRDLLSENKQIRRLIESKDELGGTSPAIQKLKDKISKIAAASGRVLIYGENGTGKGLVAKEIYKLSDRNEGPFVEVRCATIPNDNIDLELFGTEENYLPYSPGKRTGRIEQANGGILYFDEIADLSLEAQAKLVKVVSENIIEPLGSTKFIPVDIRFIASTNKNLPKLIEEGKFRDDLYHRMNVLYIEVPPLRERNEDIPVLIETFTRQICEQNSIPCKTFTNNAIEYLSSLRWEGNVRELRNTVERLVIMSDTTEIDKNAFKEEHPKFLSEFDNVLNSDVTFHEFQNISEKIFLEKKLEENNWNISKTAEILQIQRSHLYNKIKQYHIENPLKNIE